jgi:hypothetical protein
MMISKSGFMNPDKTNQLAFRKVSNECVWVNYRQEFVTTDGKIYKGYKIRLMKWNRVSGELL